MNWYLIILLTQMQGNLHEGFLWYDPTFENKRQCIEWTNANPVRIFQTLSSEFKDWKIHKTLCVREDKLEQIGLKLYIPENQI